MRKNVTLHRRIRRLVTLCCLLCMVLAVVALETLVATCNNEILQKTGTNNRMLAYLVENCMSKVETLSMDIFQNAQVQENLSVIHDSTVQSDRLLAQKSLMATISTLSLNRPNYVSLVGVIDAEGLIYSYGGILLNDQYRELLYRQTAAVKDDGKVYWFALDDGRLMLCRTIRQTRMLKLEKIGYIAILVEPDVMMRSLEALCEDAAENTLLFLNDQLVYKGTMLNEAAAALASDLRTQLQNDSLGYVIRRLDGYEYFITQYQGEGSLQYLMLDSYDALLQSLRSMEMWLLFGLAAILLMYFAVGLRSVNNGFARLNRLTGIVQKTGQDRFLEHFDDALLEQQDEAGMLALRYKELMTRIDVLVNQVLRKELAVTTARLQTLEAQINPHFLYNILDTLHAMALRAAQTSMAEMILALSHLIRASLRTETSVTMEEEIGLVREYLRIYKIRYGDQIQATIEYPNDRFLRQVVPKMILQPLVENAVQNGLEKKLGICRIHVRVRRGRKHIIVSVWDNGIGFPADKAEKYKHPEQFNDGDTHGLYNVIRRLYYLYGDDLTIHIESRKGCWTNISLSFPEVKYH